MPDALDASPTRQMLLISPVKFRVVVAHGLRQAELSYRRAIVMVMLMVVLGAGASYDSSPTVEWRPPLAKELFSDREDLRPILARHPAAASIVGRMRSLGPEGGMVEEALGDFMVMARATNNQQYKRDIVALRFYLQEIVEATANEAFAAASGVTTQMKLVTRLHDLQEKYGKKVFFVSFNYDTLLERAITDRFGYEFAALDHYVASPMPVYKPHGSINWVERLPLVQHPGTSPEPLFYMHWSQLARVADLDLSSDTNGAIEMRNSGGMQPGVGTNSFSLPGLAVPVTNKDSYMFPPSHLASLTDALEEVTAVLIVGWRASETEFRDLCGRHLPSHERLRSQVITHGDTLQAADEIIQNFAPHLSRHATKLNIHGFATAMANASHDGLDALFR